LILGQIIQITADRCHILNPRCTKFDSTRGAYSAPPADSLVGFKGATSKEKEGEGRGPYHFWHPASLTPLEKIINININKK